MDVLKPILSSLPGGVWFLYLPVLVPVFFIIVLLWRQIAPATGRPIGLHRSPRDPDVVGFRAGDYAANPLLTRWELAALGEMRHELPPSLHICPQVRLADLVSIRPKDAAARKAALNRVASKSVDFAVIDTAGRVLLVVELDDRTHDRGDRRERDALVDGVLRQCGIPVCRVRPRQAVGALRVLTEAGLMPEAPAEARVRKGSAPAAHEASHRRVVSS